MPRKAKVSGTPRQRRGVKLKPTDLRPEGLRVTDPPAEIQALASAVESDGGTVLSIHREPLGGHILLLVALPIELVAPTPFQRDVSDAHVRKLTQAMDKTKRFLDPVIAVREERAAGSAEDAAKDDEIEAAGKKRRKVKAKVVDDGIPPKYWVPNGYHRLTALRELGAKSLIALLVPETEVAYQILALNIEKAHNLREKSLGVVRMYRDLVDTGKTADNEESRELEFEEPALATLGFAYEQRPRLSGGAYHAILRKTDTWISGKLDKALGEREERAKLLLDLDEAVTEVVSKLKEKGFTSPYLRPFVVARINPLRFIKGAAPPADELLATMTKRAKGMNVDKINQSDVARTGGPPPEAE